MARRTTFIDIDTGEVCYLSNAETDAMLADVCGNASTVRASHVEPTRFVRRVAFHFLRRLFGESGCIANLTRSAFFGPWRVNLAPSNGPILSGTYTDRQQAIAAEVAWLNNHPENWIFQ